MERPESFPGAHGRPMRVVAAIVKHDKHAPFMVWPIRTRSGRLLRWRAHGLIARCGNAPRGCRGVLGYPTSRYIALKEELNASVIEPAREGMASVGEWALIHPDRYRGRPDTGYYVLSAQTSRRAANGIKVGSRPYPHAMKPSDGQARSHRPGEPGGPRRVIGQVPAPPCIVFCPICGMPNWVEAPDREPPIDSAPRRMV